MANKTCTTCGFTLGTQWFRSSIRYLCGLTPQCKICQSLMSTRWKENHKEQHAATARRHRANNREKYNWRERARHHGFRLSHDEFLEKYRQQFGECAICRNEKPHSGGHDTLSIDHDHETGGIRDLLCDKCNQLIGLAGEDTKVLQSAIDYLSRWRTAQERFKVNRG